MSEQVMVLGKVNKGINKTDSGKSYESAWLGRWTQLGNEVKYCGESSSCKELIRRPESGGKEGVEVLPFPMLKVSHKRESCADLQAQEVGSSSNDMANRMPRMYVDFPIQEKTTQNFLELIRPTSTCAMVNSIQKASGEMNLPEEDGHHQILKGFTGSMKLKGKLFGGYLDLFPRGGARLQCLESSKYTEEDGPRRNESSDETDTLEMDRLQTMHLSGSISSSSAKGKGRQPYSAVPRTEIPDMNEEPPLVPDGVDEHLGETSNSVTQSMNDDHFLSRDRKRVRLEPEIEPSSRWVKRLKTSAADSSSGYVKTKNLMEIDEASHGQKEYKNKNVFLEILKSGINNLQPRNQEPANSQLMKDVDKGGEDITLLHPWIKRWCKKKATSTSMDQPGGQEVSFAPENQKECEKKQYPSIAAMALMGKALTSLNPYGLRKTDSLMVWNSRDLR